MTNLPFLRNESPLLKTASKKSFNLKLIFFGTSNFSKLVFEQLKKEGYSPILWNQENSFDDFKKLNPEICIVAAYGKIIPKEYLEIPKYGFLNIHPSLLPKYRGASPIQTSILNGERETGVTIILMDEKIDHGPILASRGFSILNFAYSAEAASAAKAGQFSNYKNLEKELAELGAELLIDILPKWIKGEIKPREQNHDETTYTKKFSWLDGKIDWQKSADEIDRQIRALNPEPGTWTEWNSKILKILEALPVLDVNDTVKISQAFLIENKETAIKCGFRSAISPKIVQPEGKKPMEIKDFLNGHRNFIGSKLK